MVNWITENPNKKDFNGDAFGLDIVNDTPGDTDSALEYWFPNINNEAYLQETYDKIGIEKEKPKSKGVGKYKLPDISTATTGDTFDPYIQDKLDKLKLNLPSIKSADGPDSFIQNKIDALKLKKEKEQEAAYRDTFKGRLQTLFEDSGKRDAILAGISETMLETRTGADVYGSRLADVGKNVRSKLQEEEAMSMVKDQAILDMMKTQAETQAANNPMQFLSNTQKNARDYATAQGATANPPFAQGSKEWAAAYAQGLENMAMENLIMAPVEGIAAINELLARNTGMFDEATIKVFQDVITNLTGRITGDGGATTTQAGTIYGGGTSQDGVQ